MIFLNAIGEVNKSKLNISYSEILEILRVIKSTAILNINNVCT
jgi:hypothetical protein